MAACRRVGTTAVRRLWRMLSIFLILHALDTILSWALRAWQPHTGSTEARDGFSSPPPSRPTGAPVLGLEPSIVRIRPTAWRQLRVTTSGATAVADGGRSTQIGRYTAAIWAGSVLLRFAVAVCASPVGPHAAIWRSFIGSHNAHDWSRWSQRALGSTNLLAVCARAKCSRVPLL